MSLCINPRCPEPEHSGNDTSRFCQGCGSDLVLQERYRVLRLLSDKSGFGRVYEAYERSKPKILKVLKDEFNTNDKAVELFQQEAEVLSQLHHPGIPLIEPHGYFQFIPRDAWGTLHCIVMEKIDGPNLREWMKQQGYHPIGERQALNWLTQLAEILHQVHQKNYFHRDIKPENIMLRSSGQLVLVDFGAAREMTYTYLAQLESGPTGITRISSTGYTPPEQEYGQAVPQSDFYALGRTFIYLLTAKLPTDRSIYDPLSNEFRWREQAPGISPQLADFIDRLVAPRVIDRPQNTQEILDYLIALTGGTLPPQPQLSYPSAPRSGHPSAPQSGYPPTIAPTTINPTAVHNVTIPQSTAVEPPKPAPRWRWWMSGLVLLLLSIGGLGIWQFHARFGSGSTRASVELIRSLMGDSGQVNTLELSPGGQILVSAGADKTIKIWDFQTVSVLRTLEGHSSFVNTVAVSSDGGTVISGGADKTVRIWDLRTGILRRTLTGHTSFINTVLMTYNGQRLMSGSANGEIKIWEFESGKLLHTLKVNDSAVNALVMSRDDQTLASGSANGAITLWDIRSGQEIQVFEGHTSPVNALVVSRDGKYLISGDADGVIKLWDLHTGEEMLSLTGHTGAVNVLKISEDGQTLYSGSADTTIKLWDPKTGELLETLTGFPTFVNELVIAPDGQTITTNGNGGEIGVWKLPER